MSLKNNKPIIFTTELSWCGDKIGIVGAPSLKSLSVSTPPEFGGPEGEWSPEHLFLSSITSCFMSTYLSFVNKLKIENTGFECSATGQVEIVDGKYKFTYIHIYPKAFVGNDADVEKVGIEWLVSQSQELKKEGVPVLHYYTLGKPRIIRDTVMQVL